jgi:hypothetical protein
MPPDLVLDKSPEKDSEVPLAFNPRYLNLVQSTYRYYPQDCSVLRLELQNHNGTKNLTSTALVRMEDLNAPTRAQIFVKNAKTFEQTISFRSVTLVDNALMQLNVRVCGRESLTVKEKKLLFINGEVQGNPNVMADSQRYFAVDDAALIDWFTVYPANDPCIVNKLELFSDKRNKTTGERFSWPRTDTTASLVGSMGSYQLKIDLTQPDNTKVAWIRATTRGLVSFEQRVEYVCRSDNEVTVRLPLDEFYATVPTGASGANANAAFPEWNIYEVFQGCG